MFRLKNIRKLSHLHILVGSDICPHWVLSSLGLLFVFFLEEAKGEKGRNGLFGPRAAQRPSNSVSGTTSLISSTLRSAARPPSGETQRVHPERYVPIP